MPTQYDKAKRQYVRDGKYVTRVELRAHFEGLSDFVQRQAGKLGKQFDSGKLSAAEFNAAMRELLKSSHIVAASIGRGGKAQMTAKDWARVGRKINWQYGYLDKFTRKLEAGTLKANTANRAKSYVSSVYISYADSIAESVKENPPDGEKVLVRLIQNSKEGCEECNADAAAGWTDPNDMGEIGSRICGDWCLCEFEFSDEV